MKLLLTLHGLLLATLLQAQIPPGVTAYYSFADCTAVDNNGNAAKEGTLQGDISCECGVLGGDDKALSLNSSNANITFGGPIVNDFTTEDFSLSFYFKPSKDRGNQDIFSKIADPCTIDNTFSVRYLASSQTVEARLNESATKGSEVSGTINPDFCWQHVVVVRRIGRMLLYINGELVDTDDDLSTRVDVGNTAPLRIADSPCQAGQEVGFEGLIDEIRIYGNALTTREVERLYLRPDRMLNSDTLIFLGNSVDINLGGTCASNFSWAPTTAVSNPAIAEPVITPMQSGAQTYTLTLDDGGCVAIDTIRITAVDPSSLECSEIFLPNAFTPNMDGINDTFGIDNPFAIPELITFEIFDRWGSRVFFTEDVFEQWDGSFQGEEVNPGVFLYKTVHICQDEEIVTQGGVTVIR